MNVLFVNILKKLINNIDNSLNTNIASKLLENVNMLYSKVDTIGNNIVQYQTDSKGLFILNTKKYTPSGGIMPRNFTMSADGKWLLVANQASNNIVVFKRNIATGDLTKMQGSTTVSMPVCLVLF